MILNLNKDFFLGAIIWYILLGCVFTGILGLIDAEKSNKYSISGGLILGAVCIGLIVS